MIKIILMAIAVLLIVILAFLNGYHYGMTTAHNQCAETLKQVKKGKKK